MAKSQKLCPPATKKCTRNKGKEKVSSSILVESDFSSEIVCQTSSATFLGNLPCEFGDCGSSKKKFKFDLDSSLDEKVDFRNSSHENLFYSFKSKTLMHGRVVDLDLISSLNSHIKHLFEFQGWLMKPLFVFSMQICVLPILAKWSLWSLCYNTHAFISMGYSCTDDPVGDSLKGKPSSSTSISSEKLNATLEKIADMDAKLDALTISITQLSDILTRITHMDERFDNFKYLLLVTHFKMDKVQEVSKETGADVARVRLRLEQVINEDVKII